VVSTRDVRLIVDGNEIGIGVAKVWVALAIGLVGQCRISPAPSYRALAR
jgi:hypothetical protein